jgi:hypothetical protein
MRQVILADGAIITAEQEGRAIHLEISRMRGAWLSADEARRTSAMLQLLAEELDAASAAKGAA